MRAASINGTSAESLAGCKYNFVDRIYVRFTWDPQKDAANRQKHGVSFELTRRVFDDPNHISIQDRHEDGEEALADNRPVGPVAIFLVAHTYDDEHGEEIVRIISARKATKAERKRHDERT